MKSFVVIGLGLFGSSVARQLCTLGAEVLAIDTNSDLVQQVNIHLVVQKAVHLQHITGLYNAVLQDSLLNDIHDPSPVFLFIYS